MSDKASLIVLNNADLYSPEPQGVKSILIGAGRILALSDSPFEAPSGISVEVVDLGGRMVFPGYIDCHTHITGGGGEGGFATQVPQVQISQFTSVGVTTVIGLLGTDDSTRSTGNVVSRVYGLRQEGMSAFCWTGGYHLPLTTLTGSAKSDILYIEPVIGIGEFALSDHRSSQPTYDELVRLASDAYVGGLLSGKAGVLHLHMGEGQRRLDMVQRAITETELPAKVFHPTHINRNRALFDQACELMSQHGMHGDITAFPQSVVGRGWSATEAISLALTRGIPAHLLTVSSDCGGSLPIFDGSGTLLSMGVGTACTLHETLLKIWREGWEISVVLPMLTSNVADFLRLPRKGRVMEGFDADLLVLEEDGEIRDVMAMGRWHVRDSVQVVRGTYEEEN